MSHESVIASLKKLIKQDLTSIAPEEHARNMMAESDRTSIIMTAAVVEDILVHRLKLMMPTINADERDRIFNFEGPCGSFSNRIRMSQALGIIDRATRKQIEIIKEMRNVAAHSHAPITFQTPEIKEATAGMFQPEARDIILSWSRRRTRATFTSLALLIANTLTREGKAVDMDAYWEWLRNQKMLPLASRGKRSGSSPQNRRRGKIS